MPERRLVLAAMIALVILVLAFIGFVLFGIAVWIVDVSRPFSEIQHPAHHSAFVQAARDVAGPLVIAGVVVGAVVFVFRGDVKRSFRRRGQPSRSVD